MLGCIPGNLTHETVSVDSQTRLGEFKMCRFGIIDVNGLGRTLNANLDQST